MKQLFILSLATGYGGAERSIELIARHLPGDVRLHLYVEHAEHLARLRQPGGLPANARLVRLRQGRTLLGRRLAALRLGLDYLRWRPDAVLVNTHRSALLAAMLAKRLPAWAARCHLYVRDFLWTDLDYLFRRLPAVRVLVPSATVPARVGYLTAHLQPLGAAECRVIPDMVEPDDQAVTYDGPFLHLATINPWKGHADLLLACAQLRQLGVPARVDSHGVVGDADLRVALERLRDRLQLSPQFRLGDYIADPAPLLRRCRAVVVASVSHSGGPETFGRTLIEAWARRKPVIAFATGAPARLIRHEVDGLLVPEGDTAALATALRRLHEDEALCRRLGEAGYAKAIARYDASQVTAELIDHLLRRDQR